MKDKKRDSSIRDIREMGTLIIFQKKSLLSVRQKLALNIIKE